MLLLDFQAKCRACFQVGFAETVCLEREREREKGCGERERERERERGGGGVGRKRDAWQGSHWSANF